MKDYETMIVAHYHIAELQDTAMCEYLTIRVSFDGIHTLMY